VTTKLADRAYEIWLALMSEANMRDHINPQYAKLYDPLARNEDGTQYDETVWLRRESVNKTPEQKQYCILHSLPDECEVTHDAPFWSSGGMELIENLGQAKDNPRAVAANLLRASLFIRFESSRRPDSAIALPISEAQYDELVRGLMDILADAGSEMTFKRNYSKLLPFHLGDVEKDNPTQTAPTDFKELIEYLAFEHVELLKRWAIQRFDYFDTVEETIVGAHERLQERYELVVKLRLDKKAKEQHEIRINQFLSRFDDTPAPQPPEEEEPVPIEYLYNTWMVAMRSAGLDPSNLFTEFEVVDPLGRHDETESTSWWPRDQVKGSLEEYKDELQRYPGAVRPYSYGELKGRLALLENLRRAKGDTLVTACYLMLASLHARHGSHGTDLFGPRDRYPDYDAREDFRRRLMEILKQADKTDRHIPHYYTTMFPLYKDDSELGNGRSTMREYIEHLVAEQVACLKVYAPVLLHIDRESCRAD